MYDVDKEFEISLMEAVDSCMSRLDIIYINGDENYTEGVVESIGKFFQSILDAIKSLVAKLTSSEDKDKFDIGSLSKEQKRILSNKTVKAFDFDKFVAIVEKYSEELIKTVDSIRRMIDPNNMQISFAEKISKRKSVIDEFTREYVKELKKGKFITEVPAVEYTDKKNLRRPSKEVIAMVNQYAEDTIKKLESIAKSVDNERFIKFVMNESTKYSNNIAKALKVANSSSVYIKKALKIIAVTAGIGVGVTVGPFAAMKAGREINSIRDKISNYKK